MAVAGRGTMDVHEADNKIKELCEMCEDDMSDGYCVECEIHVCNKCFQQHLKIKKCRNHVLQDGPEEDSNATNIRYKPCIQHDNQAIKFHCTEHNVFGCGECMMMRHKDCKCEYVTEATKRFQDSGELGGMLTEIKTLTRTKEEQKQAIESLENKNIAMEETAINQIDSFVQSALDMIGAAKLSAIEETHSKIDRNKQSIAKHRHTLQMVDSQLADLNDDFSRNKQPHEIFMMAVESRPILSSIRNTLDSIDIGNIIKDYVFAPNKALEKVLSGEQPLGKFSDDETEEEEDFELKFKTASERIERLQEKNKTLNDEMKSKTTELEDMKLEVQRLNTELKSKTQELDTIKENEKEICLPCGHSERIEQLSGNRTIKCNVCNMVFGDQPPGTMTTTDDDRCIKMTFQFPDGILSEMNRNPGRSYTGTTKTGYLLDDNDGEAVLTMLKTAFNGNLVFTLNDRGEIVDGAVEVFTEYPSVLWDGFVVFWGVRPGYKEYIKRVKQQLADVGINQ